MIMLRSSKHPRRRHPLVALFTSLLFLTQVNAAELTYQAITDFDNISAGEVPYYIDTGGNRDVLAISATNAAYREKFARATRVFDAQSGIFDVTINALGEIDGEGEFRFLVNGELIGSAVNARVDQDWGVQQHVFEDITLTTGDVLGVESNAVSNGLIPEHDAFAFARGRWRTLTLTRIETPESPPVPESIDLQLGWQQTVGDATTGEQLNYTIEVINNSPDHVAAEPTVNISLPGALENIVAPDCNVTAKPVVCQLPELAPGASHTIELSADAKQEGNLTIRPS